MSQADGKIVNFIKNFVGGVTFIFLVVSDVWFGKNVNPYLYLGVFLLMKVEIGDAIAQMFKK